MIQKHDSNKDGLNRTDELINDYLPVVLSEARDCDRTETETLSEQVINDHHFSEFQHRRKVRQGVFS
ncbi:MAG: hypothetical protein ACI84K_000595 [Pseudohongiellaceae bacterium]|jgi:hypothetical protein